MNSDAAERVVFDAERVSYARTGKFSRVTLDYLSNAEALRPFYGRRPEPASFAAQMEEKRRNYLHRAALADALEAQYDRAGIAQEGVAKLRDENTFTVATGHQVCLFGGPLYFFYKIMSAVNTCRRLAEEYPDAQFVPVFWMATEDHDFEEANHFHTCGERVEWQSGQAGAVGRMSTHALGATLEKLRGLWGIGYESERLLAIFEAAYLKHDTVADATRYLVQELFGRYGTVVVDGDDPALKKLVKPLFYKELTEGVVQKTVSETNTALGANYREQAHAREVNLFYLGEGLRERIALGAEGKYRVLNTDKSLNRDQILAELEAHPERFSPNVLLRPVYQEAVLPNLAYVGGGGELAYWFQLKSTFGAFGVVFPVLMLRNSVALATPEAEKMLGLLDLDLLDVFGRDRNALEKELVLRDSPLTLDLDAEKRELEALFGRMKSKAGRVNKLLERSADSGLARSERIVRNLEKKMMRAERKKQDVQVGRLAKLWEVLFPDGGLQERHAHFSLPYLVFGEGWLEAVMERLDPFEDDFTVLRRR